MKYRILVTIMLPVIVGLLGNCSTIRVLSDDGTLSLVITNAQTAEEPSDTTYEESEETTYEQPSDNSDLQQTNRDENRIQENQFVYNSTALEQKIGDMRDMIRELEVAADEQGADRDQFILDKIQDMNADVDHLAVAVMEAVKQAELTNSQGAGDQLQQEIRRTINFFDADYIELSEYIRNIEQEEVSEEANE